MSFHTHGRKIGLGSITAARSPSRRWLLIEIGAIFRLSDWVHVEQKSHPHIFDCRGSRHRKCSLAAGMVWAPHLAGSFVGRPGGGLRLMGSDSFPESQWTAAVDRPDSIGALYDLRAGYSALLLPGIRSILPNRARCLDRQAAYRS